ncbi:hypothetical protein NQ314_017889 [Rhamnusium bicolor]|uniref:AB hydrolase-1 domain-containing protein n=1 Tax=Rhamnusium bicolor TaxID=1586634 RepID=A0AAV8WRP7_9CUCU|nr:hypothetical protein NQ314_017889 [Rhamnusium bicolor]
MDYILKITNKTDLFYIGHSQGATSYFAFASERPDYNRKVKLSINMAPSCLLSDTRSMVKLLGKHASLIEVILFI